MNKTLEAADKIINGKRLDEYGTAEDSFQTVADFWNAYLDSDLTPEDVAIMMCLFKIARESHSHKDDNLVDLCGYAALAQKCVDARRRTDNKTDVEYHPGPTDPKSFFVPTDDPIYPSALDTQENE